MRGLTQLYKNAIHLFIAELRQAMGFQNRGMPDRYIMRFRLPSRGPEQEVFSIFIDWYGYFSTGSRD